MRILAVTGRLAQDLVKESARGADVLVLDVDVAAFITPEMLLCADPRCYDLILLPGAITADFSGAEEALGTTIRLGPKHAADLGFVLRHLGEVELSATTPACVLLQDWMRRDAQQELQTIEGLARPILWIKEMKIGGGARMKVLAEVVDATRLGKEGLARRIDHYQKSGADMIDLGLPMDAEPAGVARTLKAARDSTDLPLSVDTLQPALIRAGLETGCDLVLSLDRRGLFEVGREVAQAGVPAVLIPGPNGIALEENLQLAAEMGISAIADPVLNPPLQGLVSSLVTYARFRVAHPGLPIFFGVGNVTELIDADSPGANALLAAMGAELGASVLFSPEHSPKAKGSISELRRASEMMILAARRRTPPKDLGMDLLILKEKRPRPAEEAPEEYQEAYQERLSDRSFVMDPAGSFRISIADGKIVAWHERMAVAGRKAAEVLNTLIDLGLVSRLDHAGYLGRELQKAELALSLGRSYFQDEPLLPKKS
jgi:dihydropteroate synthase-like protein